jgi:hypothetical protein
MTIASQNAARPVRSIVAISSALSSSSDFRMRVSSVVSGAGAAFFFFGAAFFATAFFGARLAAPVVFFGVRSDTPRF